jgi:hypothetical protein
VVRSSHERPSSAVSSSAQARNRYRGRKARCRCTARALNSVLQQARHRCAGAEFHATEIAYDPIPPGASRYAFVRHAEPCVARTLAVCNEARTLAARRDPLLPTLISGELRGSDAEKFIARAV